MGGLSTSITIDALRSGAEQLKRLLGTDELAILGPDAAVLWGAFPPTVLDESLLSRVRSSLASDARHASVIDAERLIALIPMHRDEELVGSVLTPFVPNDQEPLERAVERTWRRLRPALERLGRQFARPGMPEQPAPEGERIEEIEWLLAIEAKLHANHDKSGAIEQLLAASVERLDATFGAITIPEKRLSLVHNSRVLDDADCASAYREAHPYLMSYMQRRFAPLLANRPPLSETGKRTCKVMAVPIARRMGKQTGALAFCRPVHDRDFSRSDLSLAQHIARLIEMLLDSQLDPATGLLTRVAVEQEVARIISTYDVDEQHSVVYLNVDHLHVINETFGFDFGDQAIVRIAQILCTPSLPSNAVCGRMAGDRFVVFLPTCDTARAQQWAQSLQREVNELKVGLHPHRITISVSCGIARVPGEPGAFPRALAAAELACRTVQERGPNRCEIYRDIDDGMMHRRDDILGVVRLRTALDRNRLQIFAQRIVPLRDRTRTRAIECLVRLVAEDGAVVPPAEFLSAAKRYQLTGAIDEWMIEHALAALRPHAEMLFHGEIRVALNISEQSLCDDEFMRRLEDHVRRSDVAPGLITFEICESVASRDPARAVLAMRRIRRLGCRVALDDFGMAAGSLAHVRTLRPEQLKLDGALVRDVLEPDGAAATAAIVEVAGACQIECVAKHVEADAVLRKLEELGVRYGQGLALHAAEPLAHVLNALCEEESLQLQQLYQGQ